MASARRKQDEKNVKTLRELVSSAANRHCFECNQRGPTYVDVTIGSFVCTKCSGLLRGLTPPHRVKSISMATFTQEEIETLKSRGNEYCQRVWLGLYDGAAKPPADEHTIHSMMLDKYERKRYYMEPSIALRNSYNSNNSRQAPTTTTVTNKQDVKPLTSIIADPKALKVNNMNIIMNGFDSNGGSKTNNNGFVADFAHADIFNSSSSGTQQASFANFDDNPIFCSDTELKKSSASDTEFSIFDLQFTQYGPVYNRMPLFPKMNLNRWNFPEKFTNSTQSNPNYFNGFNTSATTNGNGNGYSNGNLNGNNAQLNPSTTLPAMQSQTNNTWSNTPSKPVEDRYAALKDLDNACKSQTQIDWTGNGVNGVNGSNSSLYGSGSPTTAGSLYSSTASPQSSSSYGSPSQGHFMNLYPQHPMNQMHETHNVSNPFNMNGFANGTTQANANPFRVGSPTPDHFSNGVGDMRSAFAAPMWTPNPFKIATTSNSNPFL